MGGQTTTSAAEKVDRENVSINFHTLMLMTPYHDVYFGTLFEQIYSALEGAEVYLIFGRISLLSVMGMTLDAI